MGRLIDLSAAVYKKAIEKAVEDPLCQLIEGQREMNDFIHLISVMGVEPWKVANAIRRSAHQRAMHRTAVGTPICWAP